MAGWYYEHNGGHVGPIGEGELRSLRAKGTIDDTTLVWHREAAPEWQPYARANIPGADVRPPPLPATHINSSYAWILAVLPLIGLAIERMLADSSLGYVPSGTAVFLAYFCVNGLLGILDSHQLTKGGHGDKELSIGLIGWLVPAYLFQRARILKQHQILLAVWIAAFVASNASAWTDLLKKDAYWGFGMPPCSGNYMAGEVKKLFDSLPYMKKLDQTAISLDLPEELNKTDSSRSCRATMVTSGGMKFPVRYDIEDKDDEYNLSIQAQPNE